MKRTAAALLIAWVCLLPTSCYGQESPSVRPQVVLDPYSSNKVAFGAKTLDRVSANSGFRSVGVQELLQRDPDLVSERRRRLSRVVCLKTASSTLTVGRN